MMCDGYSYLLEGIAKYFSCLEPFSTESLAGRSCTSKYWNATLVSGSTCTVLYHQTELGAR